MPQNFIACDRGQSFLMPPDIRDWLPENHLAWFVIDVVGVIDTSAFTPHIAGTDTAARPMNRR